jgi:hypothetical protein
VYLLSHPVLFTLLAATRRWPALRLGGTVLVHSREAFRDGLTRIPLNRAAAGTTGGAAGDLTGGDLLFKPGRDFRLDPAHRAAISERDLPGEFVQRHLEVDGAPPKAAPCFYLTSAQDLHRRRKALVPSSHVVRSLVRVGHG